MPAQKNITLQVNHSVEQIESNHLVFTPSKECDINIQVTDGWAITGHYRNQILQTITLQKTSSPVETYHG
jgi:hypothetical protein